METINYNKKFLDFAIRIVNLKKYLNEQKHEYTIADQIMRSGTSIGANHREAVYAESRDDLVHKLSIAQRSATRLCIGLNYYVLQAIFHVNSMTVYMIMQKS